MATQLSAAYEIFSRQSVRGARDTCDRGGAEKARPCLPGKHEKIAPVHETTVFFLVFQFLLN